MASTVRGCSASATSPSDSESCPKPLWPFKRVSGRTGSRAWQDARSHSRRGKDPCPPRHLRFAPDKQPGAALLTSLTSHTHSRTHTRRAPLPPRRPPPPRRHSLLALAPAARPSHHASSTPAPSLTTRTRTRRAPSHHDDIPARLGTRQGALWHPRCPTRGAARPSRKYAAGARTASRASGVDSSFCGSCVLAITTGRRAFELAALCKKATLQP
jgi:hypothetical protein